MAYIHQKFLSNYDSGFIDSDKFIRVPVLDTKLGSCVMDVRQTSPMHVSFDTNPNGSSTLDKVQTLEIIFQFCFHGCQKLDTRHHTSQRLNRIRHE